MFQLIGASVFAPFSRKISNVIEAAALASVVYLRHVVAIAPCVDTEESRRAPSTRDVVLRRRGIFRSFESTRLMAEPPRRTMAKELSIRSRPDFLYLRL
jgi:hypothetical protein